VRASEPISDVTVVVPARNEERTLHACLAAIDGALDRLRESRPAIRTRVISVLDRCTDRSAAVLDGFPHVLMLEVDAGNVGLARARGTSVAETLATAHPRAHWLAHTDADSLVPSHWLTSQLDQADAGNDLWIGTVTPVLDDLDADRRAHWLRSHPPGAALGHVHGANLGVRASAYRAVGGFAPVGEHEDVELVGRLAAAGHPAIASDEAPVLTSSRLVGRTPRGYAGYLADLGSG
jgi:glycosyltransferase involved in cell wall biosynthesis